MASAIVVGARRSFVSRVRPVLVRHPDGDGGEGGEGGAGGAGDGGGEQLGAAGLAALRAERAAKAQAERDLQAARAELEKAQELIEAAKKAAQTDEERRIAEAVEAATKTAREELSAAHKAELAQSYAKLVEARLVAAAAGRLTNPADAAAFVKIDLLERDAQGEVADSVLKAAVEALVVERPYLAAKAGSNGSADGGQRRDAAPNFKDRAQLQEGLAALNLRPR